MLKEAARSKNGIMVYVDDAATHRHGYDEETLKELIEKTELDLGEQGLSVTTSDMGRVMGKDNCLETKDGDTIVYYHRPTGNGDVREYPSRMILNRGAEPTTLMSLVIGDNCPEKLPFVYTYYAGAATPREPGDPSLTKPGDIQESEQFWDRHALVPTEEERRQIEAQSDPAADGQ